MTYQRCSSLSIAAMSSSATANVLPESSADKQLSSNNSTDPQRYMEFCQGGLSKNQQFIKIYNSTTVQKIEKIYQKYTKIKLSGNCTEIQTENLNVAQYPAIHSKQRHILRLETTNLLLMQQCSHKAN